VPSFLITDIIQAVCKKGGITMGSAPYKSFLEAIRAREKEFVQRAIDAAANSYSPYSGFPVGACLVWGDPDQGDGISFSVGCNVENSFYVCGHAEQAAAMSGIVAGYRRLLAAYVACTRPEPGSPVELVMPCGLCRQWLSEFVSEGQDAEIAIVDRNGAVRARFQLVAELLPHPFRLK
ncbi:MAG: cytidine deaminase, partial [Dehalococcoidia bacterium]|nr:cytidine deaminase [Dehalococcoidia bacterium]